MKNPIIGFIGGGNMARSMIAGLITADHNPQFIHVADRNQGKQLQLQQDYSIICTDSAEELTQMADVLILAVKPQNMAQMLASIKEILLRKDPLVLSVATGLTVKQYEDWLSPHTSIVRVMPNTPSSLQQGVSGLFANKATTLEQQQLATQLCASMGFAVWVEEEHLLQAVMAVSGCGPAYYFLFTEMLSKIGSEMGLAAEDAEQLAQQTLLGAATLSHASDDTLANLRQQVASPGGATQAALDSLRQQGLEQLLRQAMHAAVNRSQALSEQE